MLVKTLQHFSHTLLKAYLCNAGDRDRDTMAGVDFVTLNIQSQGVEGDSEEKWHNIKGRVEWMKFNRTEQEWKFRQRKLNQQPHLRPAAQ